MPDISRAVLLVVDVGNTQTHFGTCRDGELVEHWRFATVRDSTADELGAALRNLLELRGVGLADLDGVDRLLHGAAARARVGGDGGALPRPRDARRRPGHARPGCRSASTTRASSAPTGSSTRSPPTSASAAPCVVVDFGTAITYDVVSADGEYLGGIIIAGRRDLDGGADRARAPKLPKIDLGAPRSLIGKSTVDAIRSGVDLRLRRRRSTASSRRLRAELGEETDDDRHRRPGRAHRPVHRAIDEVDDLLTLTGLRLSARAQRLTATARRGADAGPVEVPNRVLLAPLAGIGNWFVRLQAKRYGAGMAVSEMVSSFAIHHRNEKTMTELLRIHPDERTAVGGPVSIQLFGQDPDVMRSAAATVAERGADLIDLNMGCPVPKVCKTGAGAALHQGPRHRGRGRARGARGHGAAGDRQAALGPAPGGDRRLRPRPPARRRGRRQRDRLPPAQRRRPPQGHARLRPRRAAGGRRSTRR